MSYLSTCGRLRIDGTVCANLTQYADGWCRQDGCTGFRTAAGPSPTTEDPGDEDSGLLEQPGGVALPPWRPVSEFILPLDSDEAYDVSVSRSAREHFIGIHGGSHAAAEAEIRALLEDALHHGKARQLPNGRWQVMTAGYQATLSADGAAVIKYATVHRERSYAQIRAGVRSRISTTTKLPTGYQRDEQQPRPSTPGTPLSIESVRLIDPSKLALTGRAIRELARQGLAGHDDTSTRALIASDLTTDLSAAEITTAEHGHIVEGSAIRWKPSLDGNVLFSAAQRKPTLASRHRRAEPCRPHLEGSGRKSEVSKMIDYVASPKFD